MKRKNYWILFAILLLSLTSLSPSLDFSRKNSQNNNNNTTSPLSLDSPEQDKNDQPITIAVQLSANEFNKLELLNKRFVQETGIQAQISNIVADNAYDEISRSLSLGEGPDVLLMESGWVNTFAAKGFLLPVESYRKSASGSNVLRSLLPSVEWNSYQWATPFDMDPYVSVWQPKSLTEMGITESPITDEEWSNLLSKQLERKEGVLLGISSDEPYALATLLGGMGTNILQPDDEHLEWIQQALPYMYLMNDNNKQQAWELIKDGKMALILSPYSEAASSWKDGLSVKLPEHFYRESSSFLRSRSFGVSSQSLLPEQSSEWIAYMTSYSIQQEWLKATNRLPSLSTIYESSTTDSLNIPFRLEVLEELNSSGDMDLVQLTNAIWSELSIQVNQLLTGKITASQFKEVMIIEGTTEEK